jgi:hypothetical protein
VQVLFLFGSGLAPAPGEGQDQDGQPCHVWGGWPVVESARAKLEVDGVGVDGGWPPSQEYQRT